MAADWLAGEPALLLQATRGSGSLKFSTSWTRIPRGRRARCAPWHLRSAASSVPQHTRCNHKGWPHPSAILARSVRVHGAHDDAPCDSICRRRSNISSARTIIAASASRTCPVAGTLPRTARKARHAARTKRRRDAQHTNRHRRPPHAMTTLASPRCAARSNVALRALAARPLRPAFLQRCKSPGHASTRS